MNEYSSNLDTVPPVPPMPQPEPKKKMSKGKMWLIGIGLFLAFATINNAINPSDATPAKSNTSTTSSDNGVITPEMIVDATIANNPGALADFCSAWHAVGENYAVGLAGFKQGYTETNPSAEAVFDEAISRC
jgi:hypothetical protein